MTNERLGMSLADLINLRPSAKRGSRQTITADMPPKSKPRSKHIAEDISDPPTEINPYAVLKVPQTATAADVRTAYRKLALQWHPDKQQDKDEAHRKFQEIAFAYAILSDETRRKRYDTTGSLEEGEDGDFNWQEWFSEMYDGIVNGDTIKEFTDKYQGAA